MNKQLRVKNFFRAGTEEQLAALPTVDPRYRQAFSTCVHCEDHFVALAPGVHIEELELVKERKLVPQVHMYAYRCLVSLAQRAPVPILHGCVYKEGKLWMHCRQFNVPGRHQLKPFCIDSNNYTVYIQWFSLAATIIIG